MFSHLNMFSWWSLCHNFTREREVRSFLHDPMGPIRCKLTWYHLKLIWGLKHTSTYTVACNPSSYLKPSSIPLHYNLYWMCYFYHLPLYLCCCPTCFSWYLCWLYIPVIPVPSFPLIAIPVCAWWFVILSVLFFFDFISSFSYIFTYDYVHYIYMYSCI